MPTCTKTTKHLYSSHGGITLDGITFDFSTGSEGPKYDPYSWEEISATKDRKEIILHMGLAQWLSIDGKYLEILSDEASAKFEELIGTTLDEIYAKNYKAHNECPKCGCSDLNNESGFPGEHFLVCAKCGEIVDTIFHEAEII